MEGNQAGAGERRGYGARRVLWLAPLAVALAVLGYVGRAPPSPSTAHRLPGGACSGLRSQSVAC